MRYSTSLHLDDGDTFHMFEIFGDHFVEVDNDRDVPFRLVTRSLDKLEELRSAIDAHLAAHGDRAVPGPAVEARFIVRDGGRVVSKGGHPVLFKDRAEAALAAEIFRPDGPDGSADRAGGPEAESLESMALEELKSDLTEAAIEVGIDPDGMDDGAVIRALVGRRKRAATGAVVDADELMSSMASEWGAP